VRAERRRGHRVRDGPEQVGDLLDPVAHRRAGDVHALTLKSFFQPIQRQVVGVLAHDDVSQQTRPG